jgi:hypothetical protein
MDAIDDSEEWPLPSDSLRLLLRLLLSEVLVEVVEGLRASAVDVAVVVTDEVLLKVEVLLAWQGFEPQQSSLRGLMLDRNKFFAIASCA